MKKEVQQHPWFLDKEGNLPSGFNKQGHFNPVEYDPQVPYVVKGRTYSLKTNPTKLLEDPFDLDNLRFINPERVQRALTNIEELAQKTEKELVCMLGTGGTISMTMQD
ncbi:MAG: hypothetical protein H6767_03365 [Candidatus Peribacteria bacterium]|nr:MAG: hypothetical protein H6767_03365 [Candidatus Peribacteria bacterium]